MTQAAKAQEPSMEEILASIRRIIADDDAAKVPEKAPPKPAAKPPEPAKPAHTAAAPKAAAPARPPPPRPAAPPPRPAAAAPRPAPPPPPLLPPVSPQDDIDAMFAAPEPKANGAAPAGGDVLELTEAMEAPPEPALRHIDGSLDVVEPPPPAEPEPVETPT